MMEVTNEKAAINLTPNETEEILQNVRMILTTVKGSVGLARDFGVVAGVDAVMGNTAQLSAEILAQVEKFEPRCKVRKINYAADIDGRLIIKLVVDL